MRKEIPLQITVNTKPYQVGGLGADPITHFPGEWTISAQDGMGRALVTYKIINLGMAPTGEIVTLLEADFTDSINEAIKSTVVFTSEAFDPTWDDRIKPLMSHLTTVEGFLHMARQVPWHDTDFAEALKNVRAVRFTYATGYTKLMGEIGDQTIKALREQDWAKDVLHFEWRDRLDTDEGRMAAIASLWGKVRDQLGTEADARAQSKPDEEQDAVLFELKLDPTATFPFIRFFENGSLELHLGDVEPPILIDGGLDAARRVNAEIVLSRMQKQLNAQILGPGGAGAQHMRDGLRIERLEARVKNLGEQVDQLLGRAPDAFGVYDLRLQNETRNMLGPGWGHRDLLTMPFRLSRCDPSRPQMQVKGHEVSPESMRRVMMNSMSRSASMESPLNTVIYEAIVSEGEQSFSALVIYNLETLPDRYCSVSSLVDEYLDQTNLVDRFPNGIPLQVHVRVSENQISQHMRSTARETIQLSRRGMHAINRVSAFLTTEQGRTYHMHD